MDSDWTPHPPFGQGPKVSSFLLGLLPLDGGGSVTNKATPSIFSNLVQPARENHSKMVLFWCISMMCTNIQKLPPKGEYIVCFQHQQLPNNAWGGVWLYYGMHPLVDRPQRGQFQGALFYSRANHTHNVWVRCSGMYLLLYSINLVWSSLPTDKALSFLCGDKIFLRIHCKLRHPSLSHSYFLFNFFNKSILRLVFLLFYRPLLPRSFYNNKKKEEQKFVSWTRPQF